RAVARADTAVVGHVVEAVGAVRRRLDRTDQFARRVLALHARHRLEIRPVRGVFVAGEIAIHANPVHGATARHLLLADDGDVVFRLAGDDAGAATDAGRQ